MSPFLTESVESNALFPPVWQPLHALLETLPGVPHTHTWRTASSLLMTMKWRPRWFFLCHPTGDNHFHAWPNAWLVVRRAVKTTESVKTPANHGLAWMRTAQWLTCAWWVWPFFWHIMQLLARLVVYRYGLIGSPVVMHVLCGTK